MTTKLYFVGRIEELELSLTETTHRAEEAEYQVTELKLKLKKVVEEESQTDDLVCDYQYKIVIDY